MQDHVRWVARRAGMACRGGQILRYTFCSHLAMKGAPPKAVQELAGYQDLSTTRRYMHLSPAALESAIQLLDGAGSVAKHGDTAETTGSAITE